MFIEVILRPKEKDYKFQIVETQTWGCHLYVDKWGRGLELDKSYKTREQAIRAGFKFYKDKEENEALK